MSYRINHQPIFMLSSQPWRENSLRIEAFSRDYGKIAFLARSARSRGSELRGVLVPFVPLFASWFGQEELKTLHRAEWQGGWAQPRGRALFSALYVNELVQNLLPYEDAHIDVYQALYQVLHDIGTRHDDCADSLRRFEWQLLTALGFAPDTQQDNVGNPILSDVHYLIQAEHAAIAIMPNAKIPPNSIMVKGATLLGLGMGQFSQPEHLVQAQAVTRLLLDFRLPLGINSRRILQQLNQLKRDWAISGGE